MSVKILTEGNRLGVCMCILNRSQLMLATNENPPPHACPSGSDGIELDWILTFSFQLARKYCHKWARWGMWSLHGQGCSRVIASMSAFASTGHTRVVQKMFVDTRLETAVPLSLEPAHLIAARDLYCACNVIQSRLLLISDPKKSKNTLIPNHKLHKSSVLSDVESKKLWGKHQNLSKRIWWFLSLSLRMFGGLTP